MSEAVQRLQSDSGRLDPTLTPNPNQNDIQETRKRRRRFRPEEVAVAHEIRSLATPGEAIAFSDLSLEAKRAVLPTSRMRLIEREIIEPEYDLDTGTIVSVTINPERWEEFSEDLILVAPKPVKAETQKRISNVFSDEKYKIKKLSQSNPRRDNTHGWYNWEHCYRDDMSVVEYLSFLEYPRNIMVTSKRGNSWFNGPAKIFLLQDLEKRYIGIYDSSLQESDSNYWQTPADIDAREPAPSELEVEETGEQEPRSAAG